MTDERVDPMLAKLAKAKGFREPTLYYFLHDVKKDSWEATNDGVEVDYNAPSGQDPAYWEEVSQPTLALLQRWLREVHSINVTVAPYADKVFRYRCVVKQLQAGSSYMTTLRELKDSHWVAIEFPTYEEALSAGLLFAFTSPDLIISNHY